MDISSSLSAVSQLPKQIQDVQSELAEKLIQVAVEEKIQETTTSNRVLDVLA